MKIFAAAWLMMVMLPILSDNAMDDKQQIEALYREMYEAMVRKDTATLNRVHADDFVLTHMTGMHQSKPEYIQSIANGTLNYYSAEHEQMDIKVDGNHATLTGRSRVNAAVYGGDRHTWRLQMKSKLAKTNGSLWNPRHQHTKKNVLWNTRY